MEMMYRPGLWLTMYSWDAVDGIFLKIYICLQRVCRVYRV